MHSFKPVMPKIVPIYAIRARLNKINISEYLYEDIMFDF